MGNLVPDRTETTVREFAQRPHLNASTSKRVARGKLNLDQSISFSPNPSSYEHPFTPLSRILD